MESNRSTASVVGLAGGALMVLGSFLSWASVSLDMGAYGDLVGLGGVSESVSGTSGGDGWFTLIAGAGVVAVAIIGRGGLSKGLSILMIVAAVIGLLVAVLNIMDISDMKNEFAAMDPSLADAYKVSIGIGLWGVLLGSIAGAAGAFMLRSGGTVAGPAIAEPPAPAG